MRIFPAFPSTIVAAALAVSSAARAQVTNPTNGHVYTLTASSMSIQDARLAAAALGGYLAAVNDADEQAWILAAFPGTPVSWIGLSDEATEGTYVWDSGEPFAYSAWCPGEPNNGPGGDEDYVLFGACGGGGWNDATCGCAGDPMWPALIEVPRPPTPADAYSASFSANGRFVVFESAAPDLVPDDTNGVTDVFVRDLKSGTITRVSVDSSGMEADGASTAASISGNGRFVVFESAASNLAPGDTNGISGLFVRDLKSGTTTWISADPAGGQGEGTGSSPSASAYGRSQPRF